MQKIIIDTNVLVSSLISKNYPFHIVFDLVLEEKVISCISKDLFNEYVDVLSRKKFHKFSDFKENAQFLLEELKSILKIYLPREKYSIIKDIDDNKILELAAECKADFIITGNTNDFTFPKFKKTKIVTPKEYWETYKP